MFEAPEFLHPITGHARPQAVIQQTTQLRSWAGLMSDPESGMAALPRFWKVPATQLAMP
jgi:hypothetical protein